VRTGERWKQDRLPCTAYTIPKFANHFSQYQVCDFVEIQKRQTFWVSRFGHGQETKTFSTHVVKHSVPRYDCHFCWIPTTRATSVSENTLHDTLLMPESTTYPVVIFRKRSLASFCCWFVTGRPGAGVCVATSGKPSDARATCVRRGGMIWVLDFAWQQG
jgi:hypothetical protein